MERVQAIDELCTGFSRPDRAGFSARWVVGSPPDSSSPEGNRSTCRRSSSPTPSRTSIAGFKGKAERAEAIESGTGSNVTDYVAQDGSNNIAITADIADVDAIKSMLAAPPPEVAAAMEAHGVVPPIAAYIEA